MPNENEYTELIAGAHREKPRFTEWVYQLTEPVLEARNGLADMIKQYDIDLAEGKQLDAIGVRVGVSRQLKLRITDVFFAFDDVDGIGFDLGIWKTPRDDEYGITELGDDVYRVLLKAKVALNQYKGKNESLDDLLRLVMNAFGVNTAQWSYVDKQDMSIDIYVFKKMVPPIVWELFSKKVFTLNHAGVQESVFPSIAGNLATTDGVLLTTDNGDLLLMDLK